jgi:hypothetical protein
LAFENKYSIEFYWNYTLDNIPNYAFLVSFFLRGLSMILYPWIIYSYNGRYIRFINVNIYFMMIQKVMKKNLHTKHYWIIPLPYFRWKGFQYLCQFLYWLRTYSFIKFSELDKIFSEIGQLFRNRYSTINCWCFIKYQKNKIYIRWPYIFCNGIW